MPNLKAIINKTNSKIAQNKQNQNKEPGQLQSITNPIKTGIVTSPALELTIQISVNIPVTCILKHVGRLKAKGNMLESANPSILEPR